MNSQQSKIAKSINEELKQVTYVCMLPDSVDHHGDYTSADEVRKAKENFNKSMKQANLFHMVNTDKFEVIESYLAPADMVLNSVAVVKNTWLMTLQVHDDPLWELIKQGEVQGLSIGAMADVTPVDSDE